MSERVRIMVSGFQRAADVLDAVRLGIDLLGFVFVPHDPRGVDVKAAATWLAELDTGQAKRIGVFQDRPATAVNDAVHRLRLDFVQLSGHEPRDYPRALDVPAIVRARQGVGNDAAIPLAPNVHAAYVAAARGDGTHGAKLADLHGLLASQPPQARVILAGDLSVEVLAAVAAAYHPYAIDVTRGIEAAPGRWETGRLRAFCAALGRHG